MTDGIGASRIRRELQISVEHYRVTTQNQLETKRNQSAYEMAGCSRVHVACPSLGETLDSFQSR